MLFLTWACSAMIAGAIIGLLILVSYFYTFYKTETLVMLSYLIATSVFSIIIHDALF